MFLLCVSLSTTGSATTYTEHISDGVQDMREGSARDGGGGMKDKKW